MTLNTPTEAAPQLSGPVTIWTGGSCRPNPGTGAWAAILQGADGRELAIKGAEPHTTNNRMELRAAIEGLKALNSPGRATVIGYSDYVFRGMRGGVANWTASGWRNGKGKPVPNRELWQELVAVAEPHIVEWQWTRGHAASAMNSRIDALADDARAQFIGQQAEIEEAA